MSGSIPFVFCYETLHHFPEPYPIVKEIHRVLQSGGHFFFNEEPFKKVLHINLYNAEKLNSNKQAKSRRLRKIKNVFDIFFAKKTCNEVDQDIIENDDISIRTWKKTLGFFEEKNVNLHSNAIAKTINTELFYPKNYSKFLWRIFSEAKFLEYAVKQVIQTKMTSLFKTLSFARHALKTDMNQS